jgi:hypothetical protein
VFTFVGWPLLPITIPLSIILGAVGINRARNSQAINLKTAIVGLILGALAFLFFASIVTGEIIDNNFIDGRGRRVEVTIRPSDYAFHSEGSGQWRQCRLTTARHDGPNRWIRAGRLGEPDPAPLRVDLTPVA